MSGYATTQKILRAGYFWPSLFKDCINAVRKCHNCQNFDRKMCAPPAPLHPIIAVSPFAKWGIDFITFKTSTGFTPFQLVYGLEALLPIECEIPSLQIAIELLPATSEEEKCLLYVAQLDENRRDAALAIETHAKWIKAQYDRNTIPCNFSEGDLVLLYDQANDKLGAGKFVPMWHGPFVVKCKLAKGAYELVDFDGVSLGRPRNGIYLKRYYA
eukprot:PITA_17032